jgi:hypothetical protein
MIAHQQELLLVATAIGIYLWDSATLLHFNEGMLELDASMRWRLHLGGSDTTIAGKHLYIPNPFAPHRPSFRLAWAVEGREMGESTWKPEVVVLLKMAPLVWGVGVGTFGIFPLSLIMGADLGLILVTLCCIYALIVTMLAMAWTTREAFGLSSRRCMSLAFECLICPPCAVNIVRKISETKLVNDDLMMAARRLLEFGQWEAAKVRFMSRIDDAFDRLDEDDVRSACLIKRLEYLRSHGAI